VRIITTGRFRARAGFAREEGEPPRLPSGVLLEDDEFRVEGAMLDHGIPSLAFALQEKIRIDARKSRLDQLGLRIGAWLTEAKRSARRGDAPDTKIAAGRRDISLAELLATQALTIGPGQRVAYATDLIYSPENVARVVALAQGARQLFIEAGYLDEDRALAASRRHLTAAQAGRIARAAGVVRAVPMHFSSRYLKREGELRREFEANFDGGPKAGHPARPRNGPNS
jgi:ribonuclease Z